MCRRRHILSKPGAISRPIKKESASVTRRLFFFAKLLVLILIVCVVGCVVVTVFRKLGSVVVFVCGVLCIVLFVVFHTVLPPFGIRAGVSHGGDGKYLFVHDNSMIHN